MHVIYINENTYTNNCSFLCHRGLPIGLAADKSTRINAIGDALSSCGCDIICLQEVWSREDYGTLKDRLKQSHPFYHFFYRLI